MEFEVETGKREEFVDITQEVLNRVSIGNGVIFVNSLHTTCGVLVNEGFDGDVERDILGKLTELASSEKYRHAEGNSDAHVKVALIGTGITLPVVTGKVVLGRWQRIFLAEFDGPRERKVFLTQISK